MTIYTLYVKTHRKTGLKYLGQTSRNPFTYPGSGVDWKSHLRQHGNDVVTEVIWQTTDQEERNRQGRFYSALWHVVTAADDFGDKIWANKIPETGGGGATMTSERAKKIYQDNPDMPNKRRQTMSDPTVKENWLRRLAEGKNNPVTKERMSLANSGSKNPTYDHTVRHFIHKDGTVETCTQYELRTKYGLHQGSLGKVVSGGRATHKGWRMG